MCSDHCSLFLTLGKILFIQDPVSFMDKGKHIGGMNQKHIRLTKIYKTNTLLSSNNFKEEPLLECLEILKTTLQSAQLVC